MAAERVPGGFGSKLREARERRGISLRQIANATKISMGALEALERNQVARLPGGIFSRAFVRSYAIEVGLDPDEAIQDFIAQFPNDSVVSGHLTSDRVEDNESLESHRRIASTFLRLVALSVPIAGALLYYSAGRPRLGGSLTQVSQETPSERPASADEPAPAPEPTRVVATSASATSAAGPAARTELVLVAVSAIRSCWVSAVVDGVTVIHRELRAGERHVLEVRRELVLTAGDAAALTLTLNGEDSRPLGKPGEAVTARVNPSNFRDYLATR